MLAESGYSDKTKALPGLEDAASVMLVQVVDIGTSLPDVDPMY